MDGDMIHLLIPLETEPKSYGKQHRNNNHLFWNRPQLMPRILQRLFNSQVIHPKQLPTVSRWSCASNEDLLVNGNSLQKETSGDQKCRSIFNAAGEKDHRLSPLLEVAIAAWASVWKGPVEYTRMESQKVISFATHRRPQTGLESSDVRFDVGSAPNKLCDLGPESLLILKDFPRRQVHTTRWVRASGFYRTGFKS